MASPPPVFSSCNMCVSARWWWECCAVLLRWLVVKQRETTGCEAMHQARVKTVSRSSQEWSRRKAALPQPSTQTTILNFPSAALEKGGFQFLDEDGQKFISCYCQTRKKKKTGVTSIHLSASCRLTPNTFALHLKRSFAGLLTYPMSTWRLSSSKLSSESQGNTPLLRRRKKPKVNLALISGSWQ